MIFFNVHPNRRNIALAFGAKVHPGLRMWHAPNDAVAAAMHTEFNVITEDHLKRLSLAIRRICGPKDLTGEDRNFGGNTLYIDLPPPSSPLWSLEKNIEASQWHELNGLVMERVGGRCEVCGSAEDKHMKTHGRWQYDDKSQVKKLMRIVILCPPCYMYTHIFLPCFKGRMDEAIEHKMKVNGLSWEEVGQDLKSTIQLCEHRQNYEWVLDLSMLVNSGVRVIE